MSLLKSSVIVSFFTLLSRFFGVIREVMIAYTFGTTGAADSFNLALRLPSLFRRIFGEGALSSVFIPLFNLKKSESEESASRFSSNVFMLLTMMLMLITFALVFFMDYFVYLIAPGFYNDKSKLLTSVLMCRITICYTVFICLVAFFGGILNAHKKFAAFSFSPVILSVIISLLCLLTTDPIIISAGIPFAGLLQLIFIFLAFRKTNTKITIKIPSFDNDVKLFFRKVVPAVVSASVTQINLFISQSISSFVPSTISILSYAERIYQLPLSIIGTTLFTVLLPELSSSIKNNTQRNNEILIKAMKLCVITSLPCIVCMFVLSEAIVNILYERGLFTRTDTIKTAQVLAIFSIGIPAFIINKVYSSILFAKIDIKASMKITIFSVLINVILNVIFVASFKHIGIAIATVISSFITMATYHYYVASKKYLKLDKSVFLVFIKSIVSCCVLFLAINPIYVAIFDLENTLPLKLLHLALVAILGMLCYGISMLALKIRKNY